LEPYSQTSKETLLVFQEVSKPKETILLVIGQFHSKGNIYKGNFPFQNSYLKNFLGEGHFKEEKFKTREN